MMSPGKGWTGTWACSSHWPLDSLLQGCLAVLKGEVAWRMTWEGMLMSMFPHPCHPRPCLCLKMRAQIAIHTSMVSPSHTFVCQQQPSFIIRIIVDLDICFKLPLDHMWLLFHITELPTIQVLGPRVEELNDWQLLLLACHPVVPQLVNHWLCQLRGVRDVETFWN